jgi:hypothetical protein
VGVCANVTLDKAKEAVMSTTQLGRDDAGGVASVTNLDMELEVDVIPVADAERAKELYGRLGWRLDADGAAGENFRIHANCMVAGQTGEELPQ